MRRVERQRLVLEHGDQPGATSARDRRDQRELVAVAQHVCLVDEALVDRDAEAVAQPRDDVVARGEGRDRGCDRRAGRELERLVALAEPLAKHREVQDRDGDRHGG